MIRRLEDWPRRLAEALETARSREFDWGEHDCGLLAMDVVDAMCGSDIARGWRGRYRTSKGAAGLLRRRGGIERVMTRHGLEERAVLMAQRGDVVEMPVPEGFDGAGLMLAICLGERAVGADFRGTALVPLKLGLRSWHVPF